MKHDEKYYQAVREGVRDAFLIYAEEHCISFPAMIEAAVKQAMQEYLAPRAAAGAGAARDFLVDGRAYARES